MNIETKLRELIDYIENLKCDYLSKEHRELIAIHNTVESLIKDLDGMVLVPKEPTDEMIIAARRINGGECLEREIYKAMISQQNNQG